MLIKIGLFGKPKNEDMPLAEFKDDKNILKILLSQDKAKIKKLIMNVDPEELKICIQFLNIEGSGSQDVDTRRLTNKIIVNTMIDIHGEKNLAFIWLKNNIPYKTCHQIMRDWNYSGEII